MYISECLYMQVYGYSFNFKAFWKTEDYLEKNVFTISKFYENAVGALDIYRCVTIVGPPGCGKTHTALQLASRKCRKDGGPQLYFRQALEEILTIAEKDSNAYIIVDEWLDKYLYFPSTLVSAIDCLNETYVKYIKDTKIHLILTAQEDKWNRIKSLLNDCDLFNESHLLTMNSKTFSESEKRNMVLRHFECFDIEEIPGGQKSQITIPANQAKDSANEETSNLIKKTTHVPKGTVDDFVKMKDEKEFSFPVEVDLICTHIRLMKSYNRVSNNRFETFLTKFFDTWSNDTDIKEKRSFCILVFAALLGGEISQGDFSAQKTAAMYNRICREYACQSNANKSVQKEEGKDKPKQSEFIEQHSDRELLQSNLRLQNCLYQGSKGQGCPCFVFQHSSLFRFVLLYIQKKKDEFQSFIIENATVEVLLNKCWLDDSSVDKKNNTLLKLEGSVIFSQKYFLPLAKRILSEMKNGERVPEWDKHVFLSHEKFLKVWKSIDMSHVKDVV